MPNWSDVLREVNDLTQRRGREAALATDFIRRKYLRSYAKYVKRNVITYYSGWLSKPGIAGTEIRDEDKNAFMMAVHGLDRSLGLDLFLHTPGGDISATESIIHYLHQMFGNDIRAIVPQLAMSAGTILACACKTIFLSKHSNLGPADPHLNGIPAQGVIDEFDKAHAEISKDPSRIGVWQFILSKYSPTFLNQCEQAIKLTENLLKNELEKNMFSSLPDASDKADSVANALIDFKSNLTHSRHLHAEQCKKMGLNVSDIESDKKFQDLVLTVHHCYIHSLMNTASFKIVENHQGVAFVRHTV